LFQFPTVDPIPLPAPVWLFKLLHIVTLMLHFTAVQILLGAMMVAIIWNIFGKRDSAARETTTVAGAVERMRVCIHDRRDSPGASVLQDQNIMPYEVLMRYG